MSFTLRPYQKILQSKIKTAMADGNRSVLMQAATGAGKTAMTAKILEGANAKGKRAWFIVHRRELIKQSINTFSDVGVKHGIISSGFKEEPEHNIQVCSIQTLARRFKKLQPPDLIVWDECHHVAAASWSRIFEAYPKAYHIGLTATPCRLDGKGLDKWFDVLIPGPPVEWLIDHKYLAPYRIFAPSQPDLAQVHTRMGDYARDELANTMDRPTVTGCAVEEYLKRFENKRAVVFCVSVRHSRHVVQEFEDAGVPAAHVDGDSSKEERDAAIEAFRSGDIKILSNVDLFGEGFDIPAAEVCIQLRPTQSLSLYLQQCGRVMRPAPGKKEAYILDHAGNCERHGLPDQDRGWKLEGIDKKKRKTDQEQINVRVCPNCFAASPPGRVKCPYCESQFAMHPREIEQAEGELVELDKQAMKRQKFREQSKAETLEDLVQLGIERNYKNPDGWARKIYEARQNKQARWEQRRGSNPKFGRSG